MTNKEALVAVLQVSVSDNTLEKALIDGGLSGSDSYSADNATAIDLCAIPILQGLLSQANVSEGGYSISFDRNAVQARLRMLADKHDLDILKDTPKITGASPW